MLAAGLGNRELAPQVGLNAPVKPVRGQILVSERVQPFLRHPTAHVRQTGEGVVQIGDSKEEVGFDDGTTLGELARIARRATRCFPLLANVNVVRTWGALRVMTPDGFPIYQASSDCPGRLRRHLPQRHHAGRQHAGPLVDWMRGGAEPAEIHGFKAERFHVQARLNFPPPSGRAASHQRRGPARAGARGRDAGHRAARARAWCRCATRRCPAQPRAPLCLMGVCFDCLVEVDGRQNVQSCMVEVRDGMQVRLPHGARRPGDAS